MRITIETDDQETTMAADTSQTRGAPSSIGEMAAAPSGAPPSVLARAAAQGGIDAGPAPNAAQQGSAMSADFALPVSPGAPGAVAATGSSDQDAGAAPSGIDVVVQIEQEGGTSDDDDAEGEDDDA